MSGVQEVELTHSGGWELLHDIRWFLSVIIVLICLTNIQLLILSISIKSLNAKMRPEPTVQESAQGK